ncbi:HPr kinase [Rhodopirellula sp. SWK7]|uniref:HPr kinase n=1 Tax=Rhodopirellula sp. SWK7 TaxID=595460 RepID=UPI0002BFBDFA|nr:HPr kinase [Rhodopirellula sp. SWK7]EMI42913.1 HPr kinase [Rhodopirellula sp. SWK7]
MKERSGDSLLNEYFHRMVESFQTEANRAGEMAVACELAGHPIRLRFAGERLSFLTDPLEHLIDRDEGTAESNADLQTGNASGPFEILIFCGDDLDVECPCPPWLTDEQTNGDNDAWRRDHGDVFVSHVPSCGFLQLWCRQERKAIYFINRVEQLSYWEIAAPFRTLFSWWAEDNGGQVAHAAVIGRAGEGVLIVGRGGRGKSTTAIACLDAGMDYVSDDYVLVMLQPHPTAFSLYNSAKLHTRLLQEHFPDWKERVVRNIGPEGKSLFFIHRSFPAQLKREMRIVAIVCPVITDREQSRCVPTSRAEALKGLAPSTVLQHASRESVGFSFLAKCIRQLPAYRLELGRIPSSPGALDDLLREEATNLV